MNRCGCPFESVDKVFGPVVFGICVYSACCCTEAEERLFACRRLLILCKGFLVSVVGLTEKPQCCSGKESCDLVLGE